MAGEGVPYQAQSEAFPDVPVRDEVGQPIIINPSDWAEMFELECGRDRLGNGCAWSDSVADGSNQSRATGRHVPPPFGAQR